MRPDTGERTDTTVEPRRPSGAEGSGVLLDLGGLGLFAGLAGWTLVAGEASGAGPAPIAGLVVLSAVVLILARLVGSLSSMVVPAALAGAAIVLAGRDPGDLVGSGPLGGPFGYANATGAFFAQAAVGALMLAAATRHPLARGVGWAAAVGFVAVAVGSRSMAAAVLAVGLPLVALAVRRWGRPRSAVVVLAGLAAAAVAATTFVGATYSREDPSALDRLTARSVSERRALLWADAVDLMVEHPVTGAGPGSFRRLSPTALDDRDALWAHHEFLQLGAETGVPGFLLLVLLFGWGFVRLATAPPDGVTALGAAALAVLAIHASIDYVMHFPVVPLAAAALVGAATAGRTVGSHRLHSDRS